MSAVMRRAEAALAAAVATVAAAVTSTAVAASPPLTAGAGGSVQQLSYALANEFSTVCQPVSWGTANVDAAVAATVSVQGSTYAGTVGESFRASGCDTLASGAGTVTLNVSGGNPLGAQMFCGFPTGFYGRVAGVIQMTFSGSCTVDNLTSSGVSLNSTGAWVVPVPAPSGSSLTSVVLAETWQIIP